MMKEKEEDLYICRKTKITSAVEKKNEKEKGGIIFSRWIRRMKRKRERYITFLWKTRGRENEKKENFCEVK